jgi:hypothetical protein
MIIEPYCAWLYTIFALKICYPVFSVFFLPGISSWESVAGRVTTYQGERRGSYNSTRGVKRTGGF